MGPPTNRSGCSHPTWNKTLYPQILPWLSRVMSDHPDIPTGSARDDRGSPAGRADTALTARRARTGGQGRWSDRSAVVVASM
jgi:hypothetical protein